MNLSQIGQTKPQLFGPGYNEISLDCSKTLTNTISPKNLATFDSVVWSNRKSLKVNSARESHSIWTSDGES